MTSGFRCLICEDGEHLLGTPSQLAAGPLSHLFEVPDIRQLPQGIQIWDGPVQGAAEESTGFDWSRLHAAVAAILDGQWTSYGDLAALAGTSAQSVGTHVASPSGLPKAYRVLTSDGTLAVGFHWDDPEDERGPKSLLVSEGIRFDEQGQADPAQRLSPDDLQGLIGWFDPDDDYHEGGETDAEDTAA